MNERLCECGCGGFVKTPDKWGRPRLYCHGHFRKGKTFEYKSRVPLSEETKLKISKANSGKNNGNFGKIYTHSQQTKEKIGLSNKRKWELLSDDEKKIRLEILSINLFQAHKVCNTPEVRRKAAIKMSGPLHFNWQGGISTEPYCCEFTKDYKKEILEWDGYQCQNPNCDNVGIRLCVHHIDYIKKHCHPLNLITLCISCNTRANYNREYWETLYREINYNNRQTFRDSFCK